ncbi:S-adenosyl-L-methionine-dependent methyltransferase [Gloeophyllum trabeum ATCC 11539]|uniref:S-adenosyl-L-methionine-dependent methyltransferase n=1 Tax=Gloeophyllum trabeum (strain ATCC 11539 / FP-39264 / Madison 617) TaxID=670483 RepID=S7RW30_GLOTA|nr:S-adenosyl-L-methionine-dependent methyltransferase [Gloeophyllum trabeum ATCC 11539]EPQ59060.1 S-adenosyl-L-methionine-dependent methyltransferase [Gloeophyllum trabeum ATCC 11539]
MLADKPSTASALPQVIEHKPRAFHSFPGAQYILPSDDEERSRLELQHRVICRALGNRLFIVPLSIKKGDKILDCGTGSGIWLLDIAKAVPPEVGLQGIDIESRLFPSSKPENVNFSVETALRLPDGWQDAFTFVHQRLLIAGLQAKEWPQVLREIHRVLAPGGWVQLLEAKEEQGADNKPVTMRQRALNKALFSARGLLLDCATHMPDLLWEAGFESVEVRELHLPVGAWAGDEGIETRESFLNVFRGMKTPVLKAGGLGFISSEEEFDSMMDGLAREWDETEGSTINLCVFCAQKPPSEN